MADLTRPEMAALSEQFRNAANNLSVTEKSHLIDALAAIFGLSQRRNAELWTTSNATRRNILNQNVGELELKMRASFVKAYLNIAEPTTPQKEARFTGGISERARRFRRYLSEDYTRDAASRIAISIAGWSLEYDADSDGAINDSADAIDEWQDLNDDGEPDDPEDDGEEEVSSG